MRRGLTALLGALVLASGASMNIAQASLAPRVAVADAVLPFASQPTSPRTPVEFRVVLQPQNADQLSRLIHDQQTPGSAMYHRFLTPGDFERHFGASRRTIREVSAYFTSQGLHILSTKRVGLVLHVRGDASHAAGALAATLRTTKVAGERRVVLTSPGRLPADIAAHVRGVVGLSSLRTATPHSRSLVQSTPQAPATCAASANLSSIGSGYTVAQQSQLYGFSSLWQGGAFGVGQTIAIYELAPYRPDDVSTYFTCHGLTPSLSVVNVDGGVTGPASSEATLDIEEAGALAPGAQLLVYQAPNTVTGPTDLFARIAADNSASIVSVSWGICEAQSDATAEQPIFQQMAAQGQTVIAASGDNGSSDCYDGSSGSDALAVDDPSSQATVTAVGGTYVSSLSPVVESVWNDGAQATGGGLSVLTPRPSWQVATGLNPSGTKRAVPDLSVMADPRRGFLSYFNRSWSSVGGTSIGAPLVSALVAVAAERCGVSRLGAINPRLYQLAATGSGFRDITSGSNDLFSAGGYSATVGYDLASGLGSPDPATFAAGLCPQQVSAVNSTVSAPSSATALDAAGATLDVALLDESRRAIAGAQLSVVLSQSGGAPTVVGTPALTDAQGHVALLVQTTRPGTVSARVSVGATLIGTTAIQFVAAIPTTDISRAASTLGATGPLRSALNGQAVDLVGRTASGDVVLVHAVGSTSRVNLSRGVASRRTTLSPDISCLSSCAVSWNSSGHVIVAQQIWTATPRITDLQGIAPNLPKALGVVRLQTIANNRTVLAYVSTARHAIVATWNSVDRTLRFVDRGTSLAWPPVFLSPVNGRPRVVVTTSTGYFTNVQTSTGTWSASNVLRSGTLVSPATYLDETSTLVGRTSGGQLLASSNASPITLGSTSSAPVTIMGSERHIVLGAQGGTLTVWFKTTVWRMLPLSAVANVPTSSGTVLGDGDATVITASSRYFLLAR